jgi:hypothetical protein
VHVDQTCHDAGGWCLTVVTVMRDQQPDFQKISILIAQQINSFARCQFSLFVLARNLLSTAALPYAVGKLTQLFGEAG